MEQTIAGDIRFLPLDKLVLSPLNARKTPLGEAEQAELKASLQAHGLLENLVVHTNGDDSFAVNAGGRRLMAFQALAADGVIATDHPIPCRVHDGDPEEVSLAENVERTSMHPLDQFEAFARMGERGATPAEIRGGYVYAQNVRHLLTDGKIAVNSKYVKFIRREAYEAAGGTVIADLFSSEEDAAYLDDRALVTELALDKLTAAGREVQAAECWKWPMTRLDVSYEDTSQYRRVHPQAVEPTPEQAAEIDRLADLMEEIEARGEADGWPDDLVQAHDEAEAQYNAFENKLRAYAPEDLARAGCVVTIGHNGDLDVRRGYVRPEDQEPEQKTGPEAATPYTFNAKLTAALKHFRLHVAQGYLADDFACAFDLALFTLAHRVLPEGSIYGEKLLDLSVDTTLPYSWTEQMEVADIPVPDGIDLGWLDMEPATGFAVLSKLPMADKQRLFAYCISQTLKGSLSDDGNALHKAIGRRLGVDVAKHWRPTAAYFFKWVKKDCALDVASDILGETWARTHQGEKKGVLADILESVFRGEKRPGITNEQAAAASR